MEGIISMINSMLKTIENFGVKSLSDEDEDNEKPKEATWSLAFTIGMFFIATVVMNVILKIIEFVYGEIALLIGFEQYRRMGLYEKYRHLVKKIKRKFRRMLGREIHESYSDTTLVGDTVPEAYLEAEDSDQTSEMRIPELLGQCIKMFGNFDNALVTELCKNLQSHLIPAGMLVFQPGDPYDSIFIVHTGRLRVYIMQSDGAELTLKIVGSGDCVASLLSFIDVMRGEESQVLSLWGRAELDTVILQVPLLAFRELLSAKPMLLVQSVQLIAIRLHRINLTALYHYLGMSEELVNPVNRPVKVSSAFQGSANVLSPDGVIRSISQCQMAGSLSRSASSERSLAQWSKASIPVTTLSRLSSEESLTTFPIQQNQASEGIGLGVNPLKRSRSLISALPSTQKFEESSAVSARRWTAPSGGLKHLPTSTMIDNLSSDKQPLPFDYRERAIEAMMRILGLENGLLLKDMIEIRDFPAGTFSLKDKSDRDVSLIYVIEGPLIVSQQMSEAGEKPIIILVPDGEMVGGMNIISGERVNMIITAEETCKVAVISRGNAMKLIAKRPEVILHIAAHVSQRFSLFVRQVDFALDYVQLESGKALYRQGDHADCMYIVLSGRLRSVSQTSSTKKHIVSECGKGDLIGIAEMLAEQERHSTVMAVRDTELVRMPAELLQTINILHPSTMQNLMRKLGMDILGGLQRRKGTISGGFSTGSPTTLVTSHASMLDTLMASSSPISYATVAIVPMSKDVPLGPFIAELYHSIKAITTVLRLNKESLMSILGSSILDAAAEYRLVSWLGQQEDHYRSILYECEYGLSQWTKRCIRQADIILFVGIANHSPEITLDGNHWTAVSLTNVTTVRSVLIEASLVDLAVRTQKELVLLHADVTKKPVNTMQWLAPRKWCSFHHHIRCKKRVFASHSQEKMRNEMYLRVFELFPDVHSDFSRLARFLTGTSVGMVLGGGGARGAAHIGIIQAMVESNVPIDMVGGVSIGAFMGALWCMEHNDIGTYIHKAQQWSFGMTSLRRQYLDITFPATAMLTGKSFNQSIREVFEDVQIEDLWLPYFNVTTDITDSTQRTHTRGSLWRYVRASMTLAGYLPPICDPIDGHLLLDGGYSNILPADVMQNKGRVHYIMAVDVSKHDDTDFTNFGDSLSGTRVLISWLNPWGTPLKVPSLPDIQARLALASGVRALEQVRQSSSFHYIRPPVNNFETLEFGSFDEVKDIGYKFAKDLLQSMTQRGNLPGPYHKQKKSPTVSSLSRW